MAPGGKEDSVSCDASSDESVESIGKAADASRYPDECILPPVPLSVSKHHNNDYGYQERYRYWMEKLAVIEKEKQEARKESEQESVSEVWSLNQAFCDTFSRSVLKTPESAASGKS